MTPLLTKRGTRVVALLVLFANAWTWVKSQDASVLHGGRTFRPIRVTLRSNTSGLFVRLSRSRTFFNAGGKRCNAKAMFVLKPYNLNGTLAFTIRTLRKRRYFRVADQCSIGAVKSVKALKAIAVSDPRFFFVPALSSPRGVQLESMQYRGNAIAVIATTMSASLLALRCERNSRLASPRAHVFRLADVTRGCRNIKTLNLSSILPAGGQTTSIGAPGNELPHPTEALRSGAETTGSQPTTASSSSSPSPAVSNVKLEPATANPVTIPPADLAILAAFLRQAAMRTPEVISATTRSRVSAPTPPVARASTVNHLVAVTDHGAHHGHEAMPQHIDHGARTPTTAPPRPPASDIKTLEEMLNLAGRTRRKRDTAAEQLTPHRNGVVMSNENELRASDIDAFWGTEQADFSGDQEADEFDFHFNYSNTVEYSSEGSKGIPLHAAAASDHGNDIVPYADEFIDLEKSELQADCDNANLVYIQLRRVEAPGGVDSAGVRSIAEPLVMSRDDPGNSHASRASVGVADMTETETPTMPAMPPANTATVPGRRASAPSSGTLATLAAVTEETHTTSSEDTTATTPVIPAATEPPLSTAIPIVAQLKPPHLTTFYAFLLAQRRRLKEQADAGNAPSPIH